MGAIHLSWQALLWILSQLANLLPRVIAKGRASASSAARKVVTKAAAATIGPGYIDLEPVPVSEPVHEILKETAAKICSLIRVSSANVAAVLPQVVHLLAQIVTKVGGVALSLASLSVVAVGMGKALAILYNKTQRMRQGLSPGLKHLFLREDRQRVKDTTDAVKKELKIIASDASPTSDFRAALQQYSKTALREEAKRKGLRGYSTWNKDQLVEAILAAG